MEGVGVVDERWLLPGSRNSIAALRSKPPVATKKSPVLQASCPSAPERKTLLIIMLAKWRCLGKA
jgi:hypothetical protein